MLHVFWCPSLPTKSSRSSALLCNLCELSSSLPLQSSGNVTVHLKRATSILIWLTYFPAEWKWRLSERSCLILLYIWGTKNILSHRVCCFYYCSAKSVIPDICIWHAWILESPCNYHPNWSALWKSTPPIGFCRAYADPVDVRQTITWLAVPNKPIILGLYVSLRPLAQHPVPQAWAGTGANASLWSKVPVLVRDWDEERDRETTGGFSMPKPGVGNYGGEKPISLDPSSTARGTGPHPAGRGVLPRRRPIKCKAQCRPPALNSVGKGLAGGSEHRNFHGLVETLFWRLKGEHSTRAGLQCARLGLHKHTHTHTQTKPPNSWGEGCSLLHVTMATAYLTFESK